MAVLCAPLVPVKATNGANLNTPQLMPTLVLKRQAPLFVQRVNGALQPAPQLMPTLVFKLPFPATTGGGGGGSSTQGYGS